MIDLIFQKAFTDNPEGLALVSSTGVRYTYSEVNELSGRWAHHLSEQGVTAGDFIGVLVADETQHIWIMLALDRLGAVYAPFDANAPYQKVHDALSSLDLKCLLIDDSLVESFKFDGDASQALQIISEELYAKIQASPNLLTHDASRYDASERNEYVFFSSGRTGTPKAINAGKGIGYWDRVIKAAFADCPLKKVLVTRGPGFDARVFEYLLAWSSGAMLRIPKSHERRDLNAILTICEREAKKDVPVSTVLLIASQLQGSHAEGVIRRLKAARVSNMMLTGDALTPEVKNICEQYDIALWNCYGPTEATFGLSLLRVNGLKMHENHLGTMIAPIAGGHEPEVRAVQHDGTLHIISPYLGQYLGSDESHSNFTTIDGHPAFNTGDIMSQSGAFWYYEGSIDFCNISGVKVNPQAIEAYINRFEGVKAAVVLKGYHGAVRPIAYIETHERFNLSAFKDFLSSRLSAEEMPICMRIGQLPMVSHNEKKDVDRAKLTARQDQLKEFLFKSSSDYQDALTESLKSIWCQVLSLDTVDTNTEFLFLGGTSALAQQMVSLIQAKIEKEYSYEKLLYLDKITVQSIKQSLETNAVRTHADIAIVKVMVFKGASKPNLYLLPPLLGEAYFTYRQLAEILSKMFDYNIYSLSDPGTLDERLAPKTMHEAIRRYADAINLTQRQYHTTYLLGFSFGCTLVYELANFIRASGGVTIGKLYLVDGYPPLLFQALSNTTHVQFLQALLNFIATVLNNSFYQQAIMPWVLDASLGELDKITQTNTVLDQLDGLVSNAQSKRLLRIARFHLLFNYQAMQPAERLAIETTFYLSNRQKPYLAVVNQIETTESNRHFFFWNQYIDYIIRRGISVKENHLELISPEQSSRVRGTEFWIPERSVSDTMDIIHSINLACFMVIPTKDDKLPFQLIVSYLNGDGSSRRVYDWLIADRLNPKMMLSETLFTPSSNEQDAIKMAMTYIVCDIPNNEIYALKELREHILFKQVEITELPTASIDLLSPIALEQEKPKLARVYAKLILMIMQGGLSFMTMTFESTPLPEDVVAEITSNLKIQHVRQQNSTDQVYHIVFDKAVENPVIAARKQVCFFGALIAPYIKRHRPSIVDPTFAKAIRETIESDACRLMMVFLENLKSNSEICNEIRSVTQSIIQTAIHFPGGPHSMYTRLMAYIWNKYIRRDIFLIAKDKYRPGGNASMSDIYMLDPRIIRLLERSIQLFIKSAEVASAIRGHFEEKALSHYDGLYTLFKRKTEIQVLEMTEVLCGSAVIARTNDTVVELDKTSTP